jgi:GGDEF domain-containing protein
MFSIKNFSAYNKEFGWSSGDKFLKEFGDTLTNYFEDSLVFRIFGDDFIVTSIDENDLDEVLEVLDKLIEDKMIYYTLKSIDLGKTEIFSLNDLELFQRENN